MDSNLSDSSFTTPVQLVYCTDTMSMHDFKHHLDWHVVDYDLKMTMNLPSDFEIKACQAAAEGKKLESFVNTDRIFSSSWGARNEIRSAIERHASSIDGLSKGFLFYAPRSFALKVIDKYNKTAMNERIYCIGNIEDLKTI